MKKLIAMVLVLSVLLTSAALASDYIVVASRGDSNLRTGPGLNYTSVAVLYQGEGVYFDGCYAYDARGVVWYAINWYGTRLWVSSTYTDLCVF